MVWDYFHEIIWRQRCEKTVKWERKEGILWMYKRNQHKKQVPKTGILAKRKTQKRTSNQNNAESSTNEEGKLNKKVKRRKMEQKQGSFNLCMLVIGDRILASGKPFWCGT